MLTFTNPGVLDPRAITTFGVNVKENQNPIGHFGTGLKYAIAVVLRLGGAIQIRTADEDHTVKQYSFTTTAADVRGKTFHFVHMETVTEGEFGGMSQPLGFTTELGKDWKPWMAYRELRSNTMDEGGFSDATLSPPMTEITIICPEIEAAHAEAGSFFLETVPLWSNADLEIHPARDDGAVFYRGIRVAKIGQAEAVFTYNILCEERLTEDRTLDLWSCSYRIARAVALLGNQELADAILLAPSSAYEASLSFDYVAEFSPEMREAIRLRRNNVALNLSAARRARALYIDDFIPLAIPMMLSQRRKVVAAMELLATFGIAVAWTDIRLGQMPEDDAEAVVLIGTTLWMGPATFDAENWLLHVLANRWSSTPWSEFRDEKQLLSIMRLAQPGLTVFQE